jgi:hypothetical protein
MKIVENLKKYKYISRHCCRRKFHCYGSRICGLFRHYTPDAPTEETFGTEKEVEEFSGNDQKSFYC